MAGAGAAERGGAIVGAEATTGGATWLGAAKTGRMGIEGAPLLPAFAAKGGINGDRRGGASGCGLGGSAGTAGAASAAAAGAALAGAGVSTAGTCVAFADAS